ncbi:ABC transporter ATP-binding protein [Nocardia sp. NPDC004711]
MTETTSTLTPPQLTSRPGTEDTPPEPGVRCHRISKCFADQTLALDDVELDCPAGELVVLLGPSGCGKTTLLRTIAGLERATSGQIFIAGQDMTSVEPQRRGVGMVFQDYALYPDKTVAENIGFPLRMAKLAKSARRVRVAAVAKLLEIDHLLDRRPNELSGGQRQRVGIGRAIVRNPQVLLMDEPLSNLDAQLRVQLRAEILRVQRALGSTTVYVTHDQTEALTLGDRIAVMRDGRIEQYGTPSQVFGHPQTTFVARFLGDMNLIDGDGHGCRDVVIGVRPEKLRLGEPSADELAVSGHVVLSELLGVERLVHVDTGRGTTIRARVPADVPLPEQLTLCARPGDLHHFDAASGHRRAA